MNDVIESEESEPAIPDTQSDHTVQSGRRQLVLHGKKLLARIKDLISIATNSAFRRWIQAVEDASAKRRKSKSESKPGRPSINESIANTTISSRK